MMECFRGVLPFLIIELSQMDAIRAAPSRAAAPSAARLLAVFGRAQRHAWLRSVALALGLG